MVFRDLVSSAVRETNRKVFETNDSNPQFCRKIKTYVAQAEMVTLAGTDLRVYNLFFLGRAYRNRDDKSTPFSQVRLAARANFTPRRIQHLFFNNPHAGTRADFRNDGKSRRFLRKNDLLK